MTAGDKPNSTDHRTKMSKAKQPRGQVGDTAAVRRIKVQSPQASAAAPINMRFDVLRTAKPKRAMRPSGPTKTAYFSFHHPELVPGGAQLVAHRLHKEHLRRHGPQSSVFISAVLGGGPKRPAGSNLVQVAPQEFVYVSEAFDYEFFTNYDERGQSALLELLESFQPDVLHFHHFMGFGLDFLQACVARLDATSVFTIHEHLLVCHNDGHLLQRKNGHVCREVSYARCATCLPEYRYDYFQHRMAHFRRVIEQFDEITAVSEFSATVVRQALGLDAQISVVPNGPVLGNRAEPKALDLSTLRIAFIGQVHRTKGVHLLLESLKTLCSEDWSVATRLDVELWGNFVGDEGYRGQVEGLISELAKLKVRVQLKGVYDVDELPALLADRNVVVVPSLWPESYCLTADEAVATGKILVCSDFPAIRERFAESEGVLFFAMGSAGALRASLKQLLARSAPTTPSVSTLRCFETFSNVYDLYEKAYEGAQA